MLGADGVMLGSRLWSSPEALVYPNHQRAALAANGDGTSAKSLLILLAARLAGRVHRTCIAHGVRYVLARPGGGASCGGGSRTPGLSGGCS